MDVDCQPFLEGLDVRDEVRVCSAGLRSDARVPLYSSNIHLFPVCVTPASYNSQTFGSNRGLAVKRATAVLRAALLYYVAPV